MAHFAQPFASRFAHLNNHDNVDKAAQTADDSQSCLGSSDSHLPHHHSQSTLIQANAPLRVHVERVVRDYFAALDDEIPTNFYELILKEVELPLLTVVLELTRGNQTKCAQILGLNRGTLRKKLKTYDLM